MKLYVGNRNYSSWSMRPWVLMRQAGIPFEEIVVRFDSFEPGSAFKRAIAERSNAAADLDRVRRLWRDCLAASGGPFLFGDFGIADAFFAPVVMRARTYALPLDDDCRAYAQRVTAAPGVAAWIELALAEKDFLVFEEPYRSGPG
jgi:glutathione S-transferase